MDRAEFLQARITHNEVQGEQIYQCRFLLGRTNVDVGAHHMSKALQAVYEALAEVGRAIETDRDELASFAIVVGGDDDGT